MTKKVENRTKEMQELMDDKDIFVPSIITALIEKMADMRFPTPVFWYFVLCSAMRVIRQNLSEEMFRETIEHCMEEQNDYVDGLKDNIEEDNRH